MFRQASGASMNAGTTETLLKPCVNMVPIKFSSEKTAVASIIIRTAMLRRRIRKLAKNNDSSAMTILITKLCSMLFKAQLTRTARGDIGEITSLLTECRNPSLKKSDIMPLQEPATIDTTTSFGMTHLTQAKLFTFLTRPLTRPLKTIKHKITATVGGSSARG